jgi:aryl-alcohol dehydrogenase-like predicted oxidoreductase
MNYRELGDTGLKVSEVGMGGNRLGQGYAPDEHWVQLVRRAVELGVNVFDTAERYGGDWGRSEEMIGRAVGNRADVYIATKISHAADRREGGYSAENVVKAAEGSLKRLQRDVIDIYQLHSPSREEMANSDWAEGMVKLQEQGKIRLAAVAIRTPDDGLWLMENFPLVKVMQITYNIFETEVEDALFEAAQAHGVGLLVRMPLARGVLTGKFEPGQDLDENQFRARLDGEKALNRIEIVEKYLRPIAENYEGGLTRMAHHFALTPRAVSAIIPGARTVEQLEENVLASNQSGLPGDIHDQIEQARREWEA